MMMWIGLLICNLIVPVTMILFGKVMIKYPPKKINGIYGYRTRRSMKNQETWDFAHAYCGKLWWKLGWIMFLAVAIVMLGILWSSSSSEVIVSQMHYKEKLITYSTLIIEILEVIVLVASIIPVEKALRQTFDEDGKRK